MFKLEDLPYSYDALEPYIDTETMHLHHDKHHATYTDKFNDAIKGSSLEGLSIEEILKREEGLVITSTPNQDNPLMSSSTVRGIPLLALDVWEHAYYLKYRNMRAEYVRAFWNVVDWGRVEELMK
jgi:Fe-Mn family superoxide dismutase